MSSGVSDDILGSYEELRWMESHNMSSPSPCLNAAKLEKEKAKRKR